MYRILALLLGIVLFYAPFALFIKATAHLLESQGLIYVVGDVHRACLRMPINWAFLDPAKLISRVLINPLYLTVFLLVVVSFFLAPLFCGWMCPAGNIPEHLNRFVPKKLKLNLRGKLDPAPIRYGFLVGFILSPKLGGSIACSFCNYSQLQRVLSAIFGDFHALAYWSSTAIITFALWFLILGLFIDGGRGWCNFACPAGALQNLSHWIGSKLPFTFKVRFFRQRCTDCGKCVEACPTWAIREAPNSVKINRLICNACKDCVEVCPTEALVYSKGQEAE
jgi:ferredoxin-type protein NapH